MMKDKIIPAIESKIFGLEKPKSIENSDNPSIKIDHVKWIKIMSMSCIFIFVAFIIAPSIFFIIYLMTQPKTANTEFQFANAETTIGNSALKPFRRSDKLLTCNQIISSMPHRGCIQG